MTESNASRDLPRPEPAQWPGVSIVVPVRDQEAALPGLVDRFLSDPYPGPIELILILGPSTDGTERLAELLAVQHPRITVVRNPTGRISVGLNAAVFAAEHQIIARATARGHFSPGYLDRAVALLVAKTADCVGGAMRPIGSTPFEQAVARAMTSPFGVGPARFHIGGDQGPTHSVYLGVYRRDALERLGGFDEHFAMAHDWELNYRIRRSGGMIWFDPELWVDYRAQSTCGGLARHYFTSGQWRRQVVRRYPETLSTRYTAAPSAVLAIVVGLVCVVVGLVTGLVPLWVVGLAPPVGYLVTVLAAAVREGRGLAAAARVRLPVVFVCMHMSWGVGFLVGAHRQEEGTARR